ncbi:hypothetical protein DFH06DRAFT_1143120 [Mycena polygramma]|nr:hypothetical protein DFH06DRAFT_1143120 [Mycena polygramma]
MVENPCRAVVKFMPVWKAPPPLVDVSLFTDDLYADMPELDNVSDSDDEVPDLVSNEVFVRRSIDQISLISIDDGYQFPLALAMDANFRLRRSRSPLPSVDLQRGEAYANEHFTMYKCPSKTTVWHSVLSTYDESCQHRCRCPDNHGENTELAWGKPKTCPRIKGYDITLSPLLPP